MQNQPPPSRNVLWWVLAGALGGGLFLAFDGAILGAILGSLDKGRGPLQGALSWAAYLGLGGAILGGIIGGLARLLGPSMVLEPPKNDDDPAP